MTKPHEETWEQHPSNAPESQNAWITLGPYGPLILTVPGGNKERTKLALAVPEMERALLSIREVLSSHPRLRHDVELALKKAGVLP